MHPSSTFDRNVVLAALLVGMLAACGETTRPARDAAAATTLSQVVPAAPTRLVTGLQGAFGSAVGPGGALYVTEPAAGRILRIDPRTGAVTTFASGFPTPILSIGGVTDVAFRGSTAYALVTLVGADVGGHDAVGLYRVDGPTSHTLVADIGAFSLAHPPVPRFFIPSGVQYALEPFRGEFLVTDGHHNRVLRVTRSGDVSELVTFGNIVPTGLAVRGDSVFMAEAGPIPHLPETGRIVEFDGRGRVTRTVASGARLLVDVEFGRGRTLFALSQGVWTGPAEGFPATPGTGSLVRVNDDGTFTTLASGLDRPTSLEVIGNTAYVVTLGGEVWTVDDVAGPPFGRAP
ncbi:ScyD/ScyE family protein [Deinococcus pimensis]|uniref:ScyD/ScyE family protein n=1 Tax=Deinococcus pimensis TaxID=309888 RepID=UPI0004811C46|nr:ScyD/ScyE family protein [Deinococcus pimensis]